MGASFMFGWVIGGGGGGLISSVSKVQIGSECHLD